jgi:hypothetical protein
MGVGREDIWVGSIRRAWWELGIYHGLVTTYLGQEVLVQVRGVPVKEGKMEDINSCESSIRVCSAGATDIEVRDVHNEVPIRTPVGLSVSDCRAEFP